MLVLASASPRRRELLAQAGFQFDVAAAHINEDPRPDENPIAYVTRLAREKAEAIARLREYAAHPETVVLGADTTVVAPSGEMLAKPLDDADAARMYGRIFSAARAAGQASRSRLADLLIASTAAANSLAVYTRNPSDFEALKSVVKVVPV